MRCRATLILVVVGASALAGCLGGAPAGTGDDGGGPSEAPIIALTDRSIADDTTVSWSGSTLDASEGDGSGCPSAACERVAFEVDAPADGSDLGDELVVSATWDPYVLDDKGADPTGSLQVRVVSPDGEMLAEGEAVWWSAVAVLEDPEPGAYVAEVEATGGETAYVGGVQLQDRPANGSESSGADGTDATDRDLLPDLVTKPAIHLTRDRPMVRGTDTVDDAVGMRGCTAYETTERDARNCLRFTTSIGNLGEGPLEVRLGYENATRAMTPLESRFVQVIHRADGSTRQVAGAEASFHPTHHHYHYHGVAHFMLYAYDAGNGSREEIVREGHKSAWCLVDMGLVDPGDGNRTTRARYPIDGSDGPLLGSRRPDEGGSNCRVATPEHDMVTGLSPGWYDMYEWHQGDQYIEVSDLPDGTYELVTRADPDGHIRESDPDNNAAGVVFAWADGQVEVLDRWSGGVGG